MLRPNGHRADVSLASFRLPKALQAPGKLPRALQALKAALLVLFAGCPATK